VLGTEATVRQAYVDDLAAKFAGDCTVLRYGSAALVEIAEAKLHGRAVAPERYAAVLNGLFSQAGGERIDVIVNACTHFPLVEAELAAASSGVRFVDGGPGIAQRIVHLTQGQDWAGAGEGIAVFTRLGDDEGALAPALAVRGFARIEQL
jgi:glutamate racemase